MADIFISYSSRDRPQATGLAEQLRSNGYSVWIDESGIDVATSWSKEIAAALSTCQTVMLLLSSSSVASKNVAKELAVASELEKHIVPVELEPVKLAGDFLYHLSGLQRAQISDVTGIVRTLTKIGIGATRASAPGPSAHARSSEPSLLRLAVLPFDDLSPAKDNEWFADGMMDELINTLGLLHQLHVNPRTDVIYYKKNKPKLDEIAADLRCRYIVEGGVQKAGEKIRIRVSLSDALQHKQVWSEKYDGTFDDIFEFQERTARAIAEALRMKLSAAEARTVTKKHTDNAEAYELFLKGQEYFVRHTKGDYERTLRLNEEAVRLDPNFAASWAIISNICQVMHSYYAPGADWLARAEEAAEKVRSLEGETAQYFWIASQNALARGDKLGALHLAQRAVEVSPGYPLAYDALAFAHQALGNLNERIVGSSRVDLQACKLEYSIVSPK